MRGAGAFEEDLCRTTARAPDLPRTRRMTDRAAAGGALEQGVGCDRKQTDGFTGEIHRVMETVTRQPAKPMTA